MAPAYPVAIPHEETNMKVWQKVMKTVDMLIAQGRKNSQIRADVTERFGHGWSMDDEFINFRRADYRAKGNHSKYDRRTE